MFGKGEHTRPTALMSTSPQATARQSPSFETSIFDASDVLNEQQAEGPGMLRQAIPDFLELARDEGVTQIGRMDVEVERSVKPKPPLDGHESLLSQGWGLQIDERDSGPGRHDDILQPETERLIESPYRQIELLEHLGYGVRNAVVVRYQDRDAL